MLLVNTQYVYPAISDVGWGMQSRWKLLQGVESMILFRMMEVDRECNQVRSFGRVSKVWTCLDSWIWGGNPITRGVSAGC